MAKQKVAEEEEVNTEWSWVSARWHLNGEPVHAGDPVEIEGWDNGVRVWFEASLESRDSGRVVFAVVRVRGVQFERVVADVSRPGFTRNVRWPS